jgi:RNA polymerase sigma-70 factor (ECF subfamily)
LEKEVDEKGQIDSLEKTILKELPVLYRVAQRIVRNPSVAEDVVGQTLLNAARAWHKFDREHPLSWLLTILRNECFKHLRGARPAVGLEEGVEVAGAADVFGAVESNLHLEAIQREMSRLPEEYRVAVELRDVEELEYEEIATVLDVPIGTVRSRIFRGRKLLLERLDEWK